MERLSLEEFKKAIPDKMKKTVNPVVIDNINEKLADPDMYETFRENLLGYAHVMRDGKFKIASYINAVKYMSYKIAGKTNMDSYALTFPEKISRWQDKLVTKKDITSYVAAYNKSKLVTLLYEQTLTPFWIMNQDLYQKAINTQAELMISAASEKVRTDAANSLLNHLKPPETQKIELDIGAKTDSTIEALRLSTQALVTQQKRILESGGMNAQEVAHLGLIIEHENHEQTG